MIERLCVIGVGLIGGSIARAARQQGLCRTIVGIDLDPANLQLAQQLGVIDEGATDYITGVREADFIMIATPVGCFERIFAALQPLWNDKVTYTDAGSTKVNIVQAAQRIFGYLPPNFVPGHPIAGAEHSGVSSSDGSLYCNRRVILTPTAQTDHTHLEIVEAFWQGIGAKVGIMDAHHHDEVLAATSHLPHVLAFALVHMLDSMPDGSELFQYAAGGFRDFTRIASSDPTMWTDICRANRQPIISLLEDYRRVLASMVELLQDNRSDELRLLFQTARDARQRFLMQ